LRLINSLITDSNRQGEFIMVIENAKEFIERMKSDKAFRDRIMEIEDVKARIDAIRSEGYCFTEKQIKDQNFCFYKDLGILTWCGIDNGDCTHFWPNPKHAYN